MLYIAAMIADRYQMSENKVENALYVGFMVFNATFSNISVISRWSVLILVEETGVPEENHRSVAIH